MTQWRLAAGDTPGHLDIVTELGGQVAQDLAVDVALSIVVAHNEDVGAHDALGATRAELLGHLIIGRSTF